MDTHAAYAIYAFKTDGTISLQVKGQFPYAAFLSYTVYDSHGLLFSARLDKDMAPDKGSINPFTPGALVNATNRSYTLVVAPFNQKPLNPNTIYMPPLPPGATEESLVLVMRVYLTEPGKDKVKEKPGGVPLPIITAMKGGINPTPTTCPSVAGPKDFGSFGGFSPAPAPSQGRILFYRPPVSMVPFADGSGQLKISDCTSYLMATLEKDKVAVIRFNQIPTYFNNTKTTPSTTFSLTQVRYLSMGSYGTSLIPPPGSELKPASKQGNIAGPEMRPAADGSETIVVIPHSLSDELKAQIAAIASSRGFNVMPMASEGENVPKEVPPFLIYRNKMAADGYNGAISNVPCYTGTPFSQAPESFAASQSNMGAFAPQGVECAVKDFMSGTCGK
ncbi:MAG: hypothetical protein ICV60_00190 [Pyrinomonadaceae bacterium]|nr:hypothetical protein [Pyrinomonadaceae bacterium]